VRFGSTRWTAHCCLSYRLVSVCLTLWPYSLFLDAYPIKKLEIDLEEGSGIVFVTITDEVQSSSWSRTIGVGAQSTLARHFCLKIYAWKWEDYRIKYNYRIKIFRKDYRIGTLSKVNNVIYCKNDCLQSTTWQIIIIIKFYLTTDSANTSYGSLS